MSDDSTTAGNVHDNTDSVIYPPGWHSDHNFQPSSHGHLSTQESADSATPNLKHATTNQVDKTNDIQPQTRSAQKVDQSVLVQSQVLTVLNTLQAF